MATIPFELSQTVATAFVELLNEALSADRAAVSQLCQELVPCNDALGEHPTIIVWYASEATPPYVVRTRSGAEHSKYALGIIGLINGLFTEGYNVGYEFDSGTRELLRFVVCPIRVEPTPAST